MIDFHSHIIPTIDDGAREIKETMKMLEEAYSAGFDGIISTSHYMEGYYEVNQADRKVWINGIQYALEKKKIGLSLYLGSEIYFSEKILEFIKEGKASTINGSKYILFEFPLNAKPINIEDVIYTILSEGYIPVLAHPERYVFTQKNPELIYELANQGVLMQSNYGSIIGQYGKKAQVIAERMLESNLVSFLGTDAHRANSIYTNIDSAANKIKSIIGKSKFDKISHFNAIKVIKNEKIEIEEPQPIKLSFIDKMKMN